MVLVVMVTVWLISPRPVSFHIQNQEWFWFRDARHCCHPQLSIQSDGQFCVVHHSGQHKFKYKYLSLLLILHSPNMNYGVRCLPLKHNAAGAGNGTTAL